MAAPASLIPELDDVVQHGSAERRLQTLQKITDLFLAGASQFSDDHVGLFDDVFGRLLNEIEATARAELANRLAPVSNAPVQVLRRLAKDDDVSVAGPILQYSRRLAESDLVHIAKTRSQAHLLAISSRSGITEPVTDVLARRGDLQVVRCVADNRSARLSDDGVTELIRRAEKDETLAEGIAGRPDIPAQKLRELLLRAPTVVQQRLLVSARPDIQSGIQNVLTKVSDEAGTQVPASEPARDYSEALRKIAAMGRDGMLNEAQIAEFAKSGQYEEMAAALAQVCAVPIEVVDRLMFGNRPDPILILGKSAGWQWPTVKALIIARPGRGPSGQALDNAYTNFERLSPATAQRVMRFWQARPSSAGGMR
jgi:uncharacterized protein (DUF2336 family)